MARDVDAVAEAEFSEDAPVTTARGTIIAHRCGLVDAANPCRCGRQVASSPQAGILDPAKPPFATHPRTDVGPIEISTIERAAEQLDLAPHGGELRVAAADAERVAGACTREVEPAPQSGCPPLSQTSVAAFDGGCLRALPDAGPGAARQSGDMSAKPQVLVLGGGFAALESAFLLRMRLHDAVDIRIVSDSHHFTFRPNSIYVPFGADPASLLVGLDKPLRRRHIDFVEGRAVEVDPDARLVTLIDGQRLRYDKLIVATGADTNAGEIPGLQDHAATIWTPDSMLEVRRRFQQARDAARRGERRRVLFLVPPNNKCSGPLYEIVFMLETWLRREHARDHVEIAWSTYERGYIQAFGPRLDALVTEEFAARGIDGHREEVVVEVLPEQVRYADGSTRDYDHVIAFPPYVSAVRYGGLPSDDRGFIETDLETRLVTGRDDVYAPGDAGDFPIKQAFLAFLQADAVADHIAADVTGAPFRNPFDSVSMCIMEMFDKATFAQVPVEMTGDAALPVRVRPDADGDYKVGTSPAWRLGKKMLGFSVPMRFAAGEPFHAGKAWQGMEIGIKAMSSMLAD